MANYCKKILGLDPRIRFAGKIVGKKLLSAARKYGVMHLLDKDLLIISPLSLGKGNDGQDVYRKTR